MTSLKKKAREELAATLQNHEGDVRRELNRNKWEMRKLVERQTILKRKMAELTSIINSLKT